jgi:anti-sigma regulatory factor (Ser/Thr protein kinase)
MDALEQKFTLHVPSSTQNLALIREFVVRVGQQAGLDEDDVSKLEVAVDEACTNAIEHAHAHDASKEVTVRAVFDEQTLRIEVFDMGEGFTESTPEPSVADLTAGRRTGGLGLRMMRSLMDEVSYEIVPGEKNRLRMIKRLRS